MRVLVTGASGFIGRRLVPLLLAQEHEVVAFMRDPAPLVALRLDGARLHVVAGSVVDAAAVRGAATGCAAIVHLANATAVSDPRVVDAVNVAGTAHVLEGARAAGGARVVFTSSIAANRERVGPYGASKRAAEERVRACGLPWVILRPSLVYGDPHAGLVGTLVRHLRSLPVVPVIGDGAIAIDPVHRDDLCSIIADCVRRADVVGRTYDVLGPDRVTFDDLLRRLAARLGIRRRLVHLPAAPLLLAARALGRVMASPPVTVDHVLGLTAPARVDGAAARRDFTLAWTSLDAGLAAMDLG